MAKTAAKKSKPVVKESKAAARVKAETKAAQRKTSQPKAKEQPKSKLRATVAVVVQSKDEAQAAEFTQAIGAGEPILTIKRQADGSVSQVDIDAAVKDALGTVTDADMRALIDQAAGLVPGIAAELVQTIPPAGLEVQPYNKELTGDAAAAFLREVADIVPSMAGVGNDPLVQEGDLLGVENLPPAWQNAMIDEVIDVHPPNGVPLAGTVNYTPYGISSRRHQFEFLVPGADQLTREPWVIGGYLSLEEPYNLYRSYPTPYAYAVKKMIEFSVYLSSDANAQKDAWQIGFEAHPIRINDWCDEVTYHPPQPETIECIFDFAHDGLKTIVKPLDIEQGKLRARTPIEWATYVVAEREKVAKAVGAPAGETLKEKVSRKRREAGDSGGMHVAVAVLEGARARNAGKPAKQTPSEQAAAQASADLARKVESLNAAEASGQADKPSAAPKGKTPKASKAAIALAEPPGPTTGPRYLLSSGQTVAADNAVFSGVENLPKELKQTKAVRFPKLGWLMVTKLA